MKSCECFGISLIVFDEAPEAGRRCECSFDDPASWQEDEAAFGLGQFDDLKCNAVFGRGIGGTLTGMTLIDPGSSTASSVTAWTVRASRSTSPRSSALAGVTWSASRCPSVSTAMWIFEPCLRFPPS